MNNKEQFDSFVSAGILKPEQDVERVERLVRDLIYALHIPSEERMFTTDPVRLTRFDIDRDEPANWPALWASVSKLGDAYVITIVKAAEGQCPTLCDYIERHLKAWGWENVIVKTEW